MIIKIKITQTKRLTFFGIGMKYKVSSTQKRSQNIPQ